MIAPARPAPHLLTDVGVPAHALMEDYVLRNACH